MLEFYPDHRPPIVPANPHSATARRTLAQRAVALVALALAACAALPPDTRVGPDGKLTAPPTPRSAEPPPPPVNLSGFPLPYRQGYADGCASATGPERKDAARYAGDGNYRTGWIDGQALCRRR
jgi:hypothetical protein